MEALNYCFPTGTLKAARTQLRLSADLEEPLQKENTCVISMDY